MRTKKFKDLFWFGPKSKILAGSGLDKGRFPFYTSSPKLTKWIDKEQYFDEALIFGTGGLASVHFADTPFSTSTDCLVTLPTNKEIKTKYVYYYLFGNIHILEQGFKGAGLKHISKKYIENLDIPILPIETQNKIVAILDKASALISKREESIAILDELLKAVFLDMFGDAFSNSKNWPQEPLGKNLDFITSGSRGWAQYYSDEGELFLRINNLGFNELLLNDTMYVIAPESAEAIRTQVKERDVLVSITADLGRTAVIPKKIPKAFVNQHIAILRPNKKINPYYLSGFISSVGGRQLLQKYAKGAAKSALNFPDIKVLQISIPKMNLQNKFEEVCLFLKEEKEKFLTSKQEIEFLFKSIIQKVFYGQLNFNIDTELDSQIKEIDDHDQNESIEIYSATDNDRTEPKPEKNSSLWATNSVLERASSIPFNETEGNIIFENVFAKKSKGFCFDEFEGFVKEEGFTYVYSELKDFIFNKIENKEIIQYYSNKEWRESNYDKDKSPFQDDFAGDGKIYLVPNKIKK